MNVLKRSIAMAICLMLLAAGASASPLLTKSNGTAWLGENNYLFVKDTTGVVKQLPSPIADIVGMDNDNLYCLTAGKRLYAVRLDGSSSSALLTNPTEEQLAKYMEKADFTLVDGILGLLQADGTQSQAASGVAAAAENDTQIFYVIQEADGKCRLYGLPRQVDSMTLSPIIFNPVVIPLPISLTASRDAVVAVSADSMVTVVSLETGETLQVPAAAPDAAAAAYANGKIFQYRQLSGHDWQLIAAAPVTLPAKAGQEALPSQVPVVSVQPAAVTAAPRYDRTVVVTPVPTARPTVRPTTVPEQQDNTIRKWDRGSRVKNMQRRLSELGYPVGKVDGVFGNNTETAVNLFQSAIGVTEHSYVTEKVQNRLYAASAPVYDPYMNLKKGDKGIRVRQMQEALKIRGYDPGKIDGVYGTNTVCAVAAYQQALGMELMPGEKPGELASSWLLLNLYTNLPPKPVTQTDLNPGPGKPTTITPPPAVVTDPPATWTDIQATQTNL